ncbi:uncharacterized protein AAG666_007053 isoform 1-T5 [Megaptera novaeangliae]
MPVSPPRLLAPRVVTSCVQTPQSLVVVLSDHEGGSRTTSWQERACSPFPLLIWVSALASSLAAPAFRGSGLLLPPSPCDCTPHHRNASSCPLGAGFLLSLKASFGLRIRLHPLRPVEVPQTSGRVPPALPLEAAVHSQARPLGLVVPEETVPWRPALCP